MASRKWAKAVAEYLARSGLSQARLAKYAGLSTSALSNYLLKEQYREPKPTQVAKINVAIGEGFGLEIFTDCLDAIYALENTAGKQGGGQDAVEFGSGAISYFCNGYVPEIEIAKLTSEIIPRSPKDGTRKLLRTLVSRWYTRLICIVDRSAPKQSRIEEMLAIFDGHGYDLRPRLVDERTQRRLRNVEEFERVLQRTLFDLSNGEMFKKMPMNEISREIFESSEITSGRMHPATTRNAKGELELKPLGKVAQRFKAFDRIMSSFHDVQSVADQEFSEVAALYIDLSDVIRDYENRYNSAVKDDK